MYIKLSYLIPVFDSISNVSSIPIGNIFELYPEIDEFANHDIDEDGIAKSLLSYIKSLQKNLFKNPSDI